MSVFLVTWNLNRERSNYDHARQVVITHLSRYPNAHDPGLETVWFLEASTTAAVLEADIRSEFDDNDRLFVTQLHKGYHAGWLKTSVWEWINARI